MASGRRTQKRAQPRTATAIRFRPEIYERLAMAAEEHDRAINWLVNKAVEDYLDRLLPASEVRLTR